MTIGRGKRPRDPNQLATWTVAVSTAVGRPPAWHPKNHPCGNLKLVHYRIVGTV
jgi:hypothetical protein